ncbi:hypothetical protein ABE67_12075 [Cytobacillus firmus]|uniref:hypothetical protein n=1 Tax=Cytobacillus firmus TaxID=1399 RepID=UPI0018CCD2D3|nr:hypothetical protein [Cytobacillus firmus]MBG9450048.1 hypothetical protein [Cytobacillus firmus]
MGNVICCNCENVIEEHDEVILSSIFLGILCHRVCNNWHEPAIFDKGLYWFMREKLPDYFYFVEQ